MSDQLFGYTAGARLANQDSQSRRMNELAIQQNTLQLETQQIALDQQKRMQALMEGVDVPTADGPPDMAEVMDTMAGLAIRSGNPEKAKEYASTASTLRKNTVEAAEKQQAQLMRRLDMLSGLADNVTDELSWRQALGTFAMLDPEGAASAEFQQISQMPYDPGTVEQLKQGFASAKDRTAAEANAARARLYGAQTAEVEFRRKHLLPAQTAAAAARAEALRKSGAPGSKIPQAGDVNVVKDLIKRDFGATADPADVALRAREIAEHGLEIFGKTPGITKSEALRRAYAEAKQNGALGGMAPNRIPPGTRPDAAIPLAPGADATGLLKNRYYTNAQGRVGLWDGKQFRIVDMPAGGEDTPDSGTVTEEFE
ncbi:MAG: hypothetical protein SFV24_19075 [Gemmatimonadales bacterium]|nr:hypothetical protein [Gemmatimonadales bacterium]